MATLGEWLDEAERGNYPVRHGIVEPLPAEPDPARSAAWIRARLATEAPHLLDADVRVQWLTELYASSGQVCCLALLTGQPEHYYFRLEPRPA